MDDSIIVDCSLRCISILQETPVLNESSSRPNRETNSIEYGQHRSQVEQIWKRMAMYIYQAYYSDKNVNKNSHYSIAFLCVFLFSSIL